MHGARHRQIKVRACVRGAKPIPSLSFAMACRTSDCQHNAMAEPSNITAGSGDDPARDAVGHEGVVRSPAPPDNPAAETMPKRRPSADVQPDPSIIPSSAPPPPSSPLPSSTGQSMEGMISSRMSRQSTPRPVLQPNLATPQFIYARGHVIRPGRSTEPLSSASPEASSDASQWYRDTNQDPGRDRRFIIANGKFSVNPARSLMFTSRSSSSSRSPLLCLTS